MPRRGARRRPRAGKGGKAEDGEITGISISRKEERRERRASRKEEEQAKDAAKEAAGGRHDGIILDLQQHKHIVEGSVPQAVGRRLERGGRREEGGGLWEEGEGREEEGGGGWR